MGSGEGDRCVLKSGDHRCSEGVLRGRGRPEETEGQVRRTEGGMNGSKHPRV